MDKISEIVMVENYMETLRVIPEGETRVYNVSHCGVHQGFKMAKSRMKKQGVEFAIKLKRERKKELVEITRLKNSQTT